MIQHVFIRWQYVYNLTLNNNVADILGLDIDSKLATTYGVITSPNGSVLERIRVSVGQI